MRHVRTLAIGLALLAAFAVPLLLGGRSTLFELAQVPPADIFAITGMAMLGWLARAAKLGLLMRRLDLHPSRARVVAISLATEFAFLATPGGVGGYAAGVYYARGVGASLPCAGSITAADQLLDLMFFALVLPLAVFGLAEVPLPAGLREAALVCSALLCAVLIALVAAHRVLGRWLFAPRGLVSRLPSLRRHAAALRDFFASCSTRLRQLAGGGPRFMLGLFVCTTVQWLVRYGLLWLILAHLGSPLPFAFVLLLQGIVLHAAAWTGIPSGGGGADLGLAAALAPMVPLASLGTALLLWRFATLYLPLVAGLAALLALRVRPARVRSEPEAVGAG